MRASSSSISVFCCSCCSCDSLLYASQYIAHSVTTSITTSACMYSHVLTKISPGDVNSSFRIYDSCFAATMRGKHWEVFNILIHFPIKLTIKPVCLPTVVLVPAQTAIWLPSDTRQQWNFTIPTSHSMSHWPTTWRSYCDHRLAVKSLHPKS